MEAVVVVDYLSVTVGAYRICPEVREGAIEQKRYLRMKRRLVTCFPTGGSVRVMRTIAVREILRFIAASNVSICFGRKRWQWFATPHAFRFRQ